MFYKFLVYALRGTQSCEKIFLIIHIKIDPHYKLLMEDRCILIIHAFIDDTRSFYCEATSRKCGKIEELYFVVIFVVRI